MDFTVGEAGEGTKFTDFSPFGVEGEEISLENLGEDEDSELEFEDLIEKRVERSFAKLSTYLELRA